MGSTPFFDDPFGERLFVEQIDALVVDRLEDIAVQLGQIAGGFQRVVKLGDIGPGGTTKGDRHPLENHVGRQLGRPGGNQRMKIAAMRAAVAEKLDHFDLGRIIGRLSRDDQRVILAGGLGESRIRYGQRGAEGKNDGDKMRRFKFH